MNLKQEKLIKKFKKAYGNPTYAMLKELTGLQQTRLFRILNGMEMKVSEYFLIESLVEKKLQEMATIDKTIKKCKENLSFEALVEIERFCKKKLHMTALINEKQTQEIA